ncbi:MAG TPA: MBL fold metallo-hydrolase [Planctomycetota bacterium]|nr:MBL fold metallo-hydrolase [Planctomycetota bacterium]
MGATVTLIGNEGFQIATPSAVILIDAFYGPIPGLASAAALSAHSIAKADLILVTHAHWDHFQAAEVADVANRTGATVIGPAAAINELRRKVPAESLVKLEPASARKGFALSEKAELPAATVTAFRTFHALGHNSYLVETPAFRFFHDGDNEDTRRVDAAALGQLDALLIGPWQGSGWVEFIEKLAPARWFLMHLSEEELDQHEAGEFLPDLCDHVPLPDRLVVLRPGQSFAFE